MAEFLKILHFNDVYNVEPQKREPMGGAARFVTKMRELRNADPENTFVVFSGDAFNPSLISSVSKGTQMVPCLNALNIDVALFGNHDFDFGQAHLADLVADCNFPWLMTNAKCTLSGGNLGNGITKLVIEKGGRRLGFMGLIEKAWLATLATIDREDVDYEDFVKAGLKLAAELREVDKVDLVVAVTHMRLPNDERLAREAGGAIDLILGGHDHSYFTRVLGGVQIVKSGADFQDLSEITVQFWPEEEEDPNADPDRLVTRASFEVERHRITSKVPEDPEVKQIVDSFLTELQVKLGQPIGASAVPLDARFSSVRTHETNIGNFITDAVLDACQGEDGAGADCVIMNSGTLRADRLFPPGNLTFLDLQTTLPLMDELCVIGLTGTQLLIALENGVSKWPALEGRFPQVAGIRFLFDPAQPKGKRVVRDSVEVAGAPLDEERVYGVAAKSFVGKSGKDGYSVFLEGKVLVDEEDLLPVPTIVVNQFNVLRMINEQKGDGDLDQLRTPARRRSVWKFRRTLQSQPTSPTPSHTRTSHEIRDVLLASVRSKSVGGTPSTASPIDLDATLTEHSARKIADAAGSGQLRVGPDGVSSPLISPGAASIGSDPFSDAESPDVPAGVHVEDPDERHFAIRPEVEGRIRCMATEVWTMAAATEKYDGFILDQYGVLHNGGEPLPGVVDCLERMIAAGKHICVNSNTSKSPEVTRESLVRTHGLGILEACSIVTSGQLIRRELESNWRGKKCLLFGWKYRREDLIDLELTFTADPAEAEFLIAGGPAGITDAEGNIMIASDFEQTGVLGDLDGLLRVAARRSLPMLVANNDRISRVADGGTAFRPGVIADRYDEFGGETVRFGKPGVPIFEECIAILKDKGVTDRAKICHVGDSLHHDVAGAQAAGIDSLFVAGGIHAEDMCIVPGERPSAAALSVLCAEHRLWPTRPLAMFEWTTAP